MADDLLFNEVIWRSVKGAGQPDARAGAGGVLRAEGEGRGVSGLRGWWELPKHRLQPK